MQPLMDEPKAQKDWRKTLLPAGSNLQQAIRNLDESALQIVLVVSPEGALLGTITDGDIRRGLLRGLNLDSSIDGIINREPMVAPPEMSRSMVQELLRSNKIRQLPVVDQQRCVIGLHVWDEPSTSDRRSNLLMIMAGGRGRRLGHHTESCPKPLLPVGDKPMLEHIIERARSDGFYRIIMALHYLGSMIEDYFGDGGRWGVQIQYVREEMPLGTAGAIALLNPRPDCAFLVSNGDVLTDIRYGELLDFHNRHSAAATVAVRPYVWQHPFGVVNTNGVDITGFEEKPVIRTHINAGIYVLAPNAIESLERGEHCDMPDLIMRLRKKAQRTIVYPMHEPWLDIGRMEDYALAQSRPKAREK
jgi:dTDP-glucose pyrophosphorylase